MSELTPRSQSNDSNNMQSLSVWEQAVETVHLMERTLNEGEAPAYQVGSAEGLSVFSVDMLNPIVQRSLERGDQKLLQNFLHDKSDR